MFSLAQRQHVPVERSRVMRFPRLHLHFTASHLWRLLIVGLMTSLYTIGMWSGLLAQAHAYAASLMQPLPVLHAASPLRGSRALASSIPACPKLTGTPKVSSNGNALSGLGNMGAFTFFKQRLDDRMQLKVNVANGNLLVETSQLHIHGTGIDLDIGAVFNGLPSAATVDMGQKWNLTVGSGVSLHANNDSSVTLHTSTGSLVTYYPDSSSYGGYDEPPSMDATLFHNGDQTYTLVFQKSGECFGFDSSGKLTYDEDKNTNLITFAYNGAQLSSITDTQNRVTSVQYDSSGRITKITDPIGRIVKYLYQDGNNNLTDIVNASGKTTHFTYSGHDLQGITDAMTNTTSITYLSGDLVGSVQDAVKNPATGFDYEPSSDAACSALGSLPCTVVTDPNGGKTTYTYTGLHVQDVVDQLGHKQKNTYTPDANVTTYTDALSDLSQFNFDAATNNVTSVLDGNGAKTSLVYGDTNNPYSPNSVTDPNNNTTAYGYDSSGNRNLLSTSESKTGSSLTYTYYPDDGSSGNGKGTLKSITDGDNNVTTFAYDQYGNLTTVTPPSPLGQQTLVVDGVSRVTSVTDGNGVTIAYSYGAMDRVFKITYTKGTTTGTISYTYDDNGNQVSVSDNTGKTTFTYDADNRITTKTLPGGVIFTSTYDKVGNLQTLDDGGTDLLGTVSYGYDAANRMTTLTEPGGAQTIYGFDSANHRTSISYPNHTGMKMAYDKAGHETSSIGGMLDGNGNIQTTYSSFTYSYNLTSNTFSNLVQKVTLLDPTNWSSQAYYTRTYSYDGASRLTLADVTDKYNTEVEKWTYGYDKAGNRTSFTMKSSSDTDTYTYQSANELHTKVDGTSTITYSYDGNGNLTGSSPNGQTYAYNNKNQTKTIGSNSYTYSGATQADMVQINSTTYNYSGLGLSSQTDSSGKTYDIRCSCGLLNSERTPDGKTHYYLFDSLDSVVGLTDSNTGNKDNSYDYDPYGQIKAQQEGEVNPWKFASGFYDSSTKLYHFGARYYDPQLGRWTQQDPVGGSLGDLGSANRYVYAGDDPVNAVDPSGKDCFALWMATFTAVIGGALGALVGIIGALESISAGAAAAATAAAAAGSTVTEIAAAAAAGAATAPVWLWGIGAITAIVLFASAIYAIWDAVENEGCYRM